MSSTMDVDGLAEYLAAPTGIPWDGLTPRQQENYRELAREKISARARREAFLNPETVLELHAADDEPIYPQWQISTDGGWGG